MDSCDNDQEPYTNVWSFAVTNMVISSKMFHKLVVLLKQCDDITKNDSFIIHTTTSSTSSVIANYIKLIHLSPYLIINVGTIDHIYHYLHCYHYYNCVHYINTKLPNDSKKTSKFISTIQINNYVFLHYIFLFLILTTT